jgi:hypothetical protein
MVRKLYRNLCKRYAPQGLTFSALAWKRAVDTGDKFWRNRIDGLFLLLAGQENHCQQQFQRDTRDNLDAKKAP